MITATAAGAAVAAAARKHACTVVVVVSVAVLLTMELYGFRGLGTGDPGFNAQTNATEHTEL